MFGEKQFKIDKVIQRLLKPCTFYTLQQTLENFVNFDFYFTKLSGIDHYEKRIDYPGGHAWGHVLSLVANLKQCLFT